MKLQYLALLAIFITLIIVSLLAATQTDLSKIESRITAGNASGHDGEGIIEAELLPYTVVTGLLLAFGVIAYWVFRRRAH